MMFTYFLAVAKYCQPAACLPAWPQERGKGKEVPPHKRHSSSLLLLRLSPNQENDVHIFFGRAQVLPAGWLAGWLAAAAWQRQ